MGKLCLKKSFLLARDKREAAEQKHVARGHKKSGLDVLVGVMSVADTEILISIR